MRRARRVTPISSKASLIHLRVRWYGVTPEVPQYSFSPLILHTLIEISDVVRVAAKAASLSGS